MRHLAAALVTVALCAGMALGDMGYMNQSDTLGWSYVAMLGIVLTFALCFFDRKAD